MKYNQVVVDQCRQCSGLWFDNGEINSFQSRQVSNGNSTPTTPELESHFGESLGDSERQCVSCDNTKLIKHHLLESYHVEIDYCHCCEGVWIDRDELQQVAHSVELQSALEEINKPVNWKTWIFQVLTQLPLEYNVKVKKTPWITYSLIALNVFVFFICSITSNESSAWILSNFATVPVDFFEGKNLWSLLTSMFMHSSIIHLLGNMYFLYIIGDNLEDVLGKKLYLLIYLFCGVCADLVHIGFYTNSTVSVVGASGAVFGLFAMYMLWFKHASLTFMVLVFQKKIPVMVFFIVWIAFNILGAMSELSSVAYTAHLGGFFSGLLIAYILKDQILQKNQLLGMLSAPESKIKRFWHK